MDYKQLREEKEQIKIVQGAKYHSWRESLEADHPYVDVCPPQDAQGDPKKSKMKKVKKAMEVVSDQQAGATSGGCTTCSEEVVAEERKDEEGLSADEKSIGRSLKAGMNPLEDHMAAATRQRLNLTRRGIKKKRGAKVGVAEEAQQLDEAPPAAAALIPAAKTLAVKAGKALAPTAKAVAKDVAVSGIKDAGERAKKAIHNKINPDQVDEMVRPERSAATPEEKAAADKAHARHEAQYARGVKAHRDAKKAEGKKPLRKGEVRWQDKETGEWKSNKDAK